MKMKVDLDPSDLALIIILATDKGIEQHNGLLGSVDMFINWAKEFYRIHSRTDWEKRMESGGDDWVETVDRFITKKMKNL